MKFHELKKAFQNKYRIQVVSGLLVVSMLACTFAGCDTLSLGTASVTNGEASANASSDADELKVSDALANLGITVASEDVGKEEDVFVFADAAGAAKKTIVSEHLYNTDKLDVLEDVSNLQNIENVKGNETFTQDGSKLTWQAAGNDIYYQGSSDSTLPVTVKVTYYLDGVEISPENLAGKSGKVTIHYDYTNNQTYTEKVNGKEYTVTVPFAAITALVLDDNFQNVEVTNGKIKTTENKGIAIGYTLPGLKESLDYNEEDFSLDIDADLPEYFEVTADVTNFSLSTAMTIVADAGEFLTSDGINMDDLDDMINELSDASTQLTDGSSELAEGVDTLKDALPEFVDGMNDLKSGLKEYTDGVKEVNDSTKTIRDGINKLDNQLADYLTDEGKASLQKTISETVAKNGGDVDSLTTAIYKALRYKEDGSDSDTYSGLYGATVQQYVNQNMPAAYQKAVYNTLATAANKAAAVADGDPTPNYPLCGAAEDLGAKANYIAPLASGIRGTYTFLNGTSDNGVAEYLYMSQGASTTLYEYTQSVVATTIASNYGTAIQTGIETAMKTSAKTLATSVNTNLVTTGTTAALSSIQSIKDGIEKKDASSGYSLVTGAKALADGTQKLADNNQKIMDGVGDLLSATNDITDGVSDLDDGAHELNDGMIEFDEKGIQEIVDAYNGDINDMVNRLQVLIDAANDYQSYGGIADGISGSVKFIYKMESIEVEE